MLLATINSGTLIIALPDLERALRTQHPRARLGDPRLHDRLDRAGAHRRPAVGPLRPQAAPTSRGFASSRSPRSAPGSPASGTELILWRIAAGRRRRVPVRQLRRAGHRRLPARAARPGDGHEHDGRRRRPRASGRCSAARSCRSPGTGSSGSTCPFGLAGALWAALILRELAKPDSVRGFDMLGHGDVRRRADRPRARASPAAA